MANPPVVEEPDVHESLLGLLKSEEGGEPDPKQEDEAPEETQAEDEPETEASGDDEADVEPEEQPEETPVAEVPKTRKVKVDGEEVEVTEDELVRGYSRQQDYTRKTMKLAEDRKAFEAEAERTRVERAQYAERLDAMKAFLDQQMGAEPNWEALKAEDPAKYAAMWADRERNEKAKAKVEAEQERVRLQQMQDQQAQFQNRLVEERIRLLDAMPEWKNPKVFKQDTEAMVEYLSGTYGFTEQEMVITDHRLMVLADKARRWDEAQKAKPALQQKVKDAPVLKPGAKQPDKKPTTAKDKAFKRFQQSKKPQDAAALIEHLLEEGL